MNAIKDSIKSGRTVVGTTVTPNVDVSILAEAGYDFLLFDTLHSGWESGGCIRDWADRDVVALEGLNEGLGHSIALRAFDWGEARHQISATAISMRTTSPFQHANSRPSEHQRMLERSVATCPSCSRGPRRPVCRTSSRRCRFISR